MAQKTREQLKTYFETGDFPTEGEFADLIDSLLNLLDDSISHNDDLIDLEQAGTGVTRGHVDDGVQSIYGEKTIEDDRFNISGGTGDSITTVLDLYKRSSTNNKLEVEAEIRQTTTNYADLIFKVKTTVSQVSSPTFFDDLLKLSPGGLSTNPFIAILVTPETDSGSNDILTYNSSTGAIEKTTRASLGSITKSSNSITSAAIITPIVGSTLNDYNVTALATNATINAPTGTATDGDELTVRFKSVTEAHSLTWNAIYRGIAESIPNNTSINEPSYAMFKYNSQDTKWDLITAIWNPA